MNNKALASLAKRIRKGDEEAFNELYMQMWKPLFYIAYKYLDNEGQAMDAVQDTFLIVHTRISDLKEDIAFSAWMNQILIRECMAVLRKRKKMDIISIEGLQTELTEDREEFLPEDLLENKASCEAVLEAVSGLPVEQKNTILLYYFSDLSVKEIAEMTGSSPNAIMIKLSRARVAIKKKLEKLQFAGTPLFAVSAMPVLSRLFHNEAQQLCTDDVGAKIWDSIQLGITAGAAIGGTAATAAGSAAAVSTTAGGAVGASAGVGAGAVVQVSIGLVATILLGGGAWFYTKNQMPPTVASTNSSYMESQINETEILITQTSPPVVTMPADILERAVGAEDALLIRSWETPVEGSRNTELMAIVNRFQFNLVDYYGDYEQEKMYVLFSLEKDDQRLLLMEYYEARSTRWQVIYRQEDANSSVPSGQALQEWFEANS